MAWTKKEQRRLEALEEWVDGLVGRVEVLEKLVTNLRAKRVAKSRLNLYRKVQRGLNRVFIQDPPENEVPLDARPESLKPVAKYLEPFSNVGGR
jgi:hypothetical protein